MISSYLTLSDGTLVDFEQDDERVLQIRAGTSLTPSERPIILTLTAADMHAFTLHLAGYLATAAGGAADDRPDPERGD